MRDGTKYDRGLYPGKTNTMPSEQRKVGEQIADTIVPLDEKGSQFIADLWYEFLSSDSTARPWFLAKPTGSHRFSGRENLQ